MTNQQYVIRAAQMMNLDIIKPKRGNPGILVYDWSSGSGKCVVDCLKWEEAREQINKYARIRANS